jgi:F420-dependent oxidoreductase-like protein
MKIGLQIPHFRPSTPLTMRRWLIETLKIVDQGGFDSVWVMDHFFQLNNWLGKPETEMVEGYTTLGFFAGLTERVRIGLLVGGVIYRHPAIVVKMVSTLDVLSGGRANFGIGAAWNEFEAKSLGMVFPSKKERFEQLEEMLQIALHMWLGDTSPYEGKHFQMPYPVNCPQPLTRPHPPIMIGGMGPAKTLRMVAQYGDACNFFGGSGEELLCSRLETLKDHCQKLGRAYGDIEKTVLQTADLESGDAAQVIHQAKKLEEMGFQHIIFNIRGDYSRDNLELFTEEIIPALKD